MGQIFEHGLIRMQQLSNGDLTEAAKRVFHLYGDPSMVVPKSRNTFPVKINKGAMMFATGENAGLCRFAVSAENGQNLFICFYDPRTKKVSRHYGNTAIFYSTSSEVTCMVYSKSVTPKIFTVKPEIYRPDPGIDFPPKYPIEILSVAPGSGSAILKYESDSELSEGAVAVVRNINGEVVGRAGLPSEVGVNTVEVPVRLGVKGPLVISLESEGSVLDSKQVLF